MLEIKLYSSYENAGAGVHNNADNVLLQCYINAPSRELTMPPRPAVLIFPGGGYEYASDREAEPIANVFLAAGYSAFVLRYSVGSAAVDYNPLTDAAAAVAHLKNNAEEYYINPEMIAVCGFSAGGHLAGMIAANWNNPILSKRLSADSEKFRPAAAILGYPVVSGIHCPHVSSFHNLLGKTNTTKEEMASFSLENLIGENMPPMFIFHTATDTCVPVENSILLANTLSKYHISFELHIFPEGPHGISCATLETAPAWSAPADTAVKQNSPYNNKYVGRWTKFALRFLENLFYKGDFSS